ncbi:gamma-glutamyltransferase [Ferrimonas pelagia]|uniref:Glutathione hydrolase proenzyme n=1 Tax=Ferrimonas pelagia TaxID=1177826 RepID=A0ABP9FN45_9GAMM
MKQLFAYFILCFSIGAYGAEGAIASPERHARDAAVQVLAQGGNAVDAAITTAFVLAVTYPEAGNIGGGGFMTLWFDGQPYFLDYREVAPAQAHRDLYLDEDGDVVAEASTVGHLAVGVPGSVAGLWAAHQRFGSRPWPELVAPAIALARDGFQPEPQLLARQQQALKHFAGRTNFADYFSPMHADQRFVQTELAQTLQRIAEQGRAGFYQGTTAKLLAEQMKAQGGLISQADLSDYRVKWRTPLQHSWQEMTLISAPPPSSGGFALAQLLSLKHRRQADFADHPIDSAAYVHLVAEIEKRVFADRAEYLGDPDFTQVPLEQLLAKDYLARRAAEIDPSQISPTQGIEPGLESPQTTHFSVVDQWGNAVSNTTTLNLNFGSGVVVAGAGFLLNNEMDDFSAKPGVPNAFGVIGGDANAIAPGKRMLSSMSPSLLLRDDKVEMVIGTPGGSTIFTSVFQVLANVYDAGMPLPQAVAAPRFHHQLWPRDEIRLEPYGTLPQATQQALQQQGYRLRQQSWDLGDIQAIQRNGTSWSAVSDPRGRGASAVVSSQP